MDDPAPPTPSPAATGRRPRLGTAGEQLAVAHLQRLGYAIVARNHRTRFGEIDVIASLPGTLAFVEVKTRRASARAGSPFDAVDARKQRQVRKISAAWLAEAGVLRPYFDALRFDVIGVTVDGSGRLVALEHREGVF